MASEDLTARNGDYSVYIPSLQINSAENVRKPASAWIPQPLPLSLEPRDFNYLRGGNRYWAYKYALASAETFRGKKNNAVTAMDADEETEPFILGDSGGFQIGKGTFGEAKNWQGMNRAEVMQAWQQSDLREDIIRWCETYCTYAMTIDIPLWVNRQGEKNSPFRVCNTQDLIDMTVDNLKYLQQVRGNWTGGEHICKYLNVLQGDKGADEQLWFDAVRRFKFDGWSFAGGVGVDGGPYRIMRRLLRLADKNLLDDGYDWLHLLMLGKPSWAPLVTAIQRGIRKNINPKFTISYDSSTAYKMGGKFEKYYWAQPLTDDPKSWTLKNGKFKTSYAFAAHDTPIPLASSYCIGDGCQLCANKEPHLLAPLLSPIAKRLTAQDLVYNTENFARRRVGKLFEETVTNHNVYVIVDAMIKANEAVFAANPPNAPKQLLEACDFLEGFFASGRGKQAYLDKNRKLIEGAVAYRRKKGIVD